MKRIAALPALPVAPLLPLRAAPLPTRRTFATARRPSRIPRFDYREAFGGSPAPSVAYVNDPDEADDYLEAFRSSRLSVFIDDDMIARKSGLGEWRAFPDKTSAVCLADSEGVVVIHTAPMTQPPVLLKPLLESTRIVKQTVGAPTSVKQLLKERDPWKMRPNAFLDLRLMALQLYPELFVDTGVSHVEFLQFMVKEFLGKDYNSSTGGSRVRTSNLRGTATLEELVATTWATHLVGIILHETLELRAAEILKLVHADPEVRQELRQIPEEWIDEKEELATIKKGWLERLTCGAEDFEGYKRK